MGELYERLKTYGASDAYPFHMPGHKRRMGAVCQVRDIDITEIDGFDNLHHPEGILKEAQQRAADLYGAQETWYLINGSTAGILAAIFAGTEQRGKLLMARNCHKAAYHAAELRELRTVYLYPREIKEPGLLPDGGPGSGCLPGGDICPGDVRAALEKDPEIEAVFVTSPTYEGVVSDIKAIAGIAHSFGKPLIVDEAHGAHFGFHPAFPKSSVRLGADLVIHSLHKTMPSLTQTALLHRCGGRINGERVKKYLGMFQTSSPSYVLMAGMDECVELTAKRGTALFSDFTARLDAFYRRVGKLKNVRVFSEEDSRMAGLFDRDKSKIIITARGKSGLWLAGELRARYHLEPEMETVRYVVLITSIADDSRGFERLAAALEELDKEASGETFLPPKWPQAHFRSLQEHTIAEAGRFPHKPVALRDSEGYISGEYVYLYPPGIPLIVPGEKISRGFIREFLEAQDAGLSLQGMQDYSGKTIRVCLREE